MRTRKQGCITTALGITNQIQGYLSHKTQLVWLAVSFGARRRLDFVVVEDGKVKGVYEVTSPTADKTAQLEKEMNIRGKAEGGAHVKAPGRKGALYNIYDIETQRLDVDLNSKTIMYH